MLADRLEHHKTLRYILGNISGIDNDGSLCSGGHGGVLEEALLCVQILVEAVSELCGIDIGQAGIAEVLENIHLLCIELLEYLPHAGGKDLVVHAVLALGLFNSRDGHDCADGVDDEVGVMQSDLNGRPVVIVEVEAFKLCLDRLKILRGIYAQRIADISEADLDGAGLGNAAVDEGACSLNDAQLLVAAVLEHVSGGEIARVYDDYLAVLEVGRNSLDERLVELGLNVDDDDLGLGDKGDITGDTAQLTVADGAVDLDEGHLAVVLDHVVIVIVMQGVGGLNDRDLVAFDGKVGTYCASGIACAQNCNFHFSILSYIKLRITTFSYRNTRP